MKDFFQKYSIMLAWFQALAATVGSLFLSLVMNFPPCDLCWYQRIAMYPLVLILGLGFVKKDRNFVWYAWPLAVIGWLFAVFHTLLYYKIIPDALAPCSEGVSCTTKYIEWFGFLTIPLLSFLAFSFIILMLGLYSANDKRN